MPVEAVLISNNENILIKLVDETGNDVNDISVIIGANTVVSHTQGIADFYSASPGTFTVTTTATDAYAASSSSVILTDINDEVQQVITLVQPPPQPLQIHLECGNGSIKNLDIALVSSITSMGIPINHIISDDLVINPFNAFTRIDFQEDTASFSETPREATEGVLIETKSTFRTTKDRQSLTSILTKFVGKDVIAIAEDWNNVTRIIGNKDRPAKLICAINKGEAIESENRYKIDLVALSDEPAAYFTGEITT